MKYIYLYVFDTMADWETGYLTAELNSGRFFKKGLEPVRTVTVGIQKTPVTTMGGLKILPDMQPEECNLENAAAFILPGGDTWTEAVHDPVIRIVKRCLESEVLVAAICGATIGLARNGLLNSKPHTSIDLEFLKMTCPAYAGEMHYKMEPAVTSGKLITASGIAPLEFAASVLKALDVFSSQTLDAWYHLNKTQKSEYFYQLMESIH